MEAPDDLLAVCRINLLNLALQAKLEPLLHWFVSQVVARHAYQFQDVLRVASLVQCYAVVTLAHLNALLEAIQANVTQVKWCPHLGIELLHSFIQWASDDKIVDVYNSEED